MSYLIVFLPLIGAILGYSLKFLGDRYSEVITTTFLFLSAIFSTIVFYKGIVYGEYANYKIIEWISSGSLKVDWSINIDPLSSIMLVVVTSVSSLVHLYSIGYMNHDPNKPRFMSYLSLFTFFILTVAAAEAAIGLAIIVSYYRNKGSIRVQDINEMKG